MITREHEPQNLEFPFFSLNSFLTPAESFYVRCHFPVPVIDPQTYRLRIEGEVEHPFDLGLDDLHRLPQSTVTATLECAGNSRVLLVPKVPGTQWEFGAVGNAEWTGVPLSVLLDRAAPKAAAVDVLLEGTDSGEPENDPKPPGGTPYLRSIGLHKAQRPEVLIAHSMNGRPLRASHGFPVRAVVPGYYGMSSVKWLRRIRVLFAPFQGYWQTVDYARWDRSTGHPARRPLMDMRVKSLIARPAIGEIIKASSEYRVHGAAWTGDADIARVELSTDGGRTWTDATLKEKSGRFAWKLWEYNWRVPHEAARYTLMSRATDTNRNTQPAHHDRDDGSYAIHHTLPVEVEVI